MLGALHHHIVEFKGEITFSSSWRTLSELYTLRKLEYHRTILSGPYARPLCTERDFQAR